MDIKFELSFTEAMQAVLDGKFVQGRSEEHTSELQSH